MYYCEDCRVKNSWPDAFTYSQGKCECCGKSARCWDRPSSSLPPATFTAPATPVSAPMDEKQDRKSAFLDHLAASDKMVEGWPAWKTGLWKSEGAAPMGTNGEAIPLPIYPRPMDFSKQGTPRFSVGQMLDYARDYASHVCAQQNDRIRHLERELEMTRKVISIQELATKSNEKIDALREKYGVGSENARKDAERARGTVAWVYECLQPGGQGIWCEFFSRNQPSTAGYIRNVRPLAYIDGRTAGTAPDELVEIGNRMATTLEVLACALKNPGTAEGVRRTVEEWRAAAPTPLNGKEEANADQV